MRLEFAESGADLPVGWLPALKASVGRPLKFRIVSAKIDRAEFPVQK
jgi:hypothetical protein